MNKDKLQQLINKRKKSLFSFKPAFVKAIENFLTTIPDNNADFLPNELDALQSILKSYADLPDNSQSYQLRNAIISALSINLIELDLNIERDLNIKLDLNMVLAHMAPFSLSPPIPLLENPIELINSDSRKNQVSDLPAFLAATAVHQQHYQMPTDFRSSDLISTFNSKFYQPDKSAKKTRDFSAPAIMFSREEDPLSKEIRKLTTDLPSSPVDMVYIGTNETNTARVAEILTSIPLQAGGCHIGFSGWHNFDIMFMRKSGRGIICDINPRNALFLEAMLGLVRTAENRDDFVKKAINYINISDNVIMFSPNVNDAEESYKEIKTLSGQVKAELTRPSSWLYADNHFNYIQQLARADKIVLITQDITLTEKFSHLRKILHENQISIDSVYISNIYIWMRKEEDQQHFLNTLTLFTAADETVLIYATMGEKNLIQSAVLCGDLNKNKLDEQLALVVDPSSRARSAPK